MPIYTYNGETPAVLLGLVQDTNAIHTPAPGNPEVPAGATVVAVHGDQVETREPYPSAFLDEVVASAPAAPAPAPAPAPVEAPAAPAPAPEPTPEPLPAPAPTF